LDARTSRPRTPPRSTAPPPTPPRQRVRHEPQIHQGKIPQGQIPQGQIHQGQIHHVNPQRAKANTANPRAHDNGRPEQRRPEQRRPEQLKPERLRPEQRQPAPAHFSQPAAGSHPTRAAATPIGGRATPIRPAPASPPRELRIAALARFQRAPPRSCANAKPGRGKPVRADPARAHPAYAHPARAARRSSGPFQSVLRAALGAAVFIWAVSAAGAPHIAPFWRVGGAAAVVASTDLASAAPPRVWAIDVDGDGVADFANPTRGPIRGRDAYGTGAFGAERDAGARRHEGADYVVAAGAVVDAPISGVVTKIGFAYPDDESLRFVEVRNPGSAMSARILYVDPSVADGQYVVAGAPIGVAENLADRYPNGIINHVHVQIATSDHVFVNPADVLPSGAPPRQYALAGAQARVGAPRSRM
jgi:hypothetical protein